jgi:hemolysin-activating ACP:hemolysin acyltransferase
VRHPGVIFKTVFEFIGINHQIRRRERRSERNYGCHSQQMETIHAHGIIVLIQTHSCNRRLYKVFHIAKRVIHNILSPAMEFAVLMENRATPNAFGADVQR